MTQAQAHEIQRLQTQVRVLEDCLAAQKDATATVLDREARLQSALRTLGLTPEAIRAISDG